MKFADADQEYGESEYVVVGIPLDVTTSYRPGTRFGPKDLREASQSYEPYVRKADINLQDIDIHDYGDLDVWNDAEEVTEYASGIISDLDKDGKKPLILGGEHTVSVPGFRGVDADVFVSLDAHLDLKEEYQGESLNHASVSRIAHKDGMDVVVAGVRSGSENEYEYAESEDGVEVYGTEAFDAKKIVETVKSYDKPYLSIDLDVFDPGYAPGVGTPEPYGVKPQQAREVVEELASDCVGFDVVELCPPHDSSNPGETGFLGSKLIRDFIAFSSD